MCAPSAIVVYAVSPFERSAVNSQNLPSAINSLSHAFRKRKVKCLHCVSRMNPMRFDNSSVASGVAGTPETRQNPNRSYTVTSVVRRLLSSMSILTMLHNHLYNP